MTGQFSESGAIDALSRPEALRKMVESHLAAVRIVAGKTRQIDLAAGLMAEKLSAGGVLTYVAAGSSGLMALADASEMAGTFGIAQRQIRIAMAGGVPTGADMPGNTEDDTSDAITIAGEMTPEDLAIVISASGTTPYACAFARAVAERGVSTIGIANVDAAPLLDLVEVAIPLPTGDEVVAGSTRLGAATAQKVALNMMSTQAGILLGHVHDGMMVNLVPDNLKLRQRASDIVQRIADVPRDAANSALEAAEYDVKLAVLLASNAKIPTARRVLKQADGHLRAALKGLRETNFSTT